MFVPTELRCLDHARPLTADGEDGRVEVSRVLECSLGCRIPVINGIPRFVDSAGYAAAFGRQWNSFRKTQLDSFTGASISRDRLSKCLGGPLNLLAGKTVLEVGCGAGRFTELMLAAEAKVFACDLSEAVEANYENCRAFGAGYFVCQADVRQLPLALHSFDFVICMGVIQHTPSPEETVAALVDQVKPGGMLIIDHYSHNYPRNFMQRNLRRAFIRMPASLAKPLVLGLAYSLLPLHLLSWHERRGMGRLRSYLHKVSPLIDYYEIYPQLGKRLLVDWAVLDTHDSLTDRYKHLRTAEEIEECLRKCGVTDLQVYYGGNGIEARARIPASKANRRLNAGAQV